MDLSKSNLNDLKVVQEKLQKQKAIIAELISFLNKFGDSSIQEDYEYFYLNYFLPFQNTSNGVYTDLEISLSEISEHLSNVS